MTSCRHNAILLHMGRMQNKNKIYKQEVVLSDQKNVSKSKRDECIQEKALILKNKLNYFGIFHVHDINKERLQTFNVKHVKRNGRGLSPFRSFLLTNVKSKPKGLLLYHYVSCFKTNMCAPFAEGSEGEGNIGRLASGDGLVKCLLGNRTSEHQKRITNPLSTYCLNQDSGRH